MPNMVWLCQRTKKLARTQSCVKNYKSDLVVKGQCCVVIMNIRDTSSHGNRHMSQIWYARVKANKLRVKHDMSKPYKIDIEVKGQHCVRIMNVHDTSSYSVPKMVSQCQSKWKLWARQESAQTDRQTEWFLYTPLNFIHWGIINQETMVSVELILAKIWVLH